MNMQLEFTRAEAADAEIIFGQLKQLIDAYEDLSSIQYDKVLAWCRRQIEENIGQYTCILANGNKAGWYCLMPSGDGRMELDNFYVLPEFRGRGIGTAALERCFAETDKPVFLYCFTQNTRALALYTRMGFRAIENVGHTRCILQRNPEV